MGLCCCWDDTNWMNIWNNRKSASWLYGLWKFNQFFGAENFMLAYHISISPWIIATHNCASTPLSRIFLWNIFRFSIWKHFSIELFIFSCHKLLLKHLFRKVSDLNYHKIFDFPLLWPCYSFSINHQFSNPNEWKLFDTIIFKSGKSKSKKLKSTVCHCNLCYKLVNAIAT